MEFIKVTQDNIDKEHICCAIASDKDIQVMSKKAWMKERFRDGLVFLKGNVRGKCFIEYIPAEKAWVPIDAENYLYINCFWVSGQYKGKGYSNELLNLCLDDAKRMGKKGVVILSSKKKLGFLADAKYLTYKGFSVADTCNPYFQLMYLPLSEDAAVPRFKQHVKEEKKISQRGFVVYYTNQCPFTAKYVPILKEAAKKKGMDLTAFQIRTAEEAKNAPTPFTSFSLFYNGEFLTHEILSEKKFEKIMEGVACENGV